VPAHALISAQTTSPTTPIPSCRRDTIMTAGTPLNVGGSTPTISAAPR
jgi:hypothetical protein